MLFELFKHIMLTEIKYTNTKCR